MSELEIKEDPKVMAKREGGGAKVGLKQRVENRECAITKQKMSLGCDGVA